MTHRITHLLAAGALLTLAGACSQDAEMPRGDTPVGFIARPQTRAAVAQRDDMEDFLVWGGFDGRNNLLTAEQVDKDGNYAHTVYWVDNRTHNFYALHPASLATQARCDDNGTRTIAGFNATDRRGPQAIDLMTAEQTGLFYAKGATPAPVPLSFTHRLSRVRFGIQAEQEAVVTAVELAGVANRGDFSTAANPAWTNTSAIAIAEETSLATAPGDTQAAILLGGDLLMIPQTLAPDARLTVTWRYTGNDTPRTATCRLATDTGVSQWDEGRSYNYTLTIPADDTETDITVKWMIEDWIAGGGDVTFN